MCQLLCIILLLPAGCGSEDNYTYVSYDDCGLGVGNWVDNVYINKATIHAGDEGAAYLKDNDYKLENDGSFYGEDYINIEGWIAFEKNIKKIGYSIDGGAPVFNGTLTKVEDALLYNTGKYGKRFTVDICVEGVEGEHTVNLVAKLSDGTLVIMDGKYKKAKEQYFLPYGGNVVTTITYTGAHTEIVIPETKYTVRADWKKADEGLLDTDDLEEAKAMADKNLRRGYGVFDNTGNLVYAPVSEPAMRILREAYWVAKYCRENGFVYDNAPINPAINCDAKNFSCDRLVCWSLYRAGWAEGQPYNSGLVVYDAGHNIDFKDFLEENNFTQITDYSELLPGDIVFTWSDPSTKHHTGHVFIFAGWTGEIGGSDYRYDGGSDFRIAQYQPYIEGCGDIAYKFAYAYRAPN